MVTRTPFVQRQVPEAKVSKCNYKVDQESVEELRLFEQRQKQKKKKERKKERNRQTHMHMQNVAYQYSIPKPQEDIAWSNINQHYPKRRKKIEKNQESIVPISQQALPLPPQSHKERGSSPTLQLRTTQGLDCRKSMQPCSTLSAPSSSRRRLQPFLGKK